MLSLLASCQQTCMTYTIAVCTVKNSWWRTEELSETRSVSFQNKFEKLVHLVGFIIRICHDARSAERQITKIIFTDYSIRGRSSRHHKTGVLNHRLSLKLMVIKGTAVPVHVMKTYRPGGGGGFVLYFDAGWKWAVNFKNRPFNPREKTPVRTELGPWSRYEL